MYAMQSTTERLAKDWEDLGSMDPLYAILSHADKKNGKWDEKDFFATGDDEIRELLVKGQRLNLPRERLTAFDFGCGVGRLTRALSRSFMNVTGIDISASMVEEAKTRNVAFPTCVFLQNTRADLASFASNTFDLVYSSIVLQHISDVGAVKTYLAEFIRVLKFGGLLAFQIPVCIPLRSRLQPQQRLYHLLRTCGVSSARLYRWNLLPISMNAIEEGTVREIIKKAGGRIVEVEKNAFSGPQVESRMFYVTKDTKF